MGEDLLEPGLMNVVLNITNSQVEQTQLVLLLFLFKQGAGNVSNFRNDTVTDLIDNYEVRRFVEETLRQSNDGTGENSSDHEYAEIAEDALTAEEEVVTAEPSQPAECKVCNEILSLVTFLPCRHKVACFDCCRRMKKCLECGVKIEHRITEVTDQSPVKLTE